MATIGSVSSQRQAKQALGSTPNMGAENVASFARALGGLSSAFTDKAQTDVLGQESDTTFELKVRDRQQNIERASSLVEFSRLQGEWAREAVDIETRAAPDGSDIVPQLEGALTKRIAGFTEKLPAHLRNSMLPQIENYVQSEKNSAFNKKVSLEGKRYLVDAQDLQTTMMDAIFKGTKTPEDFEPTLQEYIKNSPLPKAESEALGRSMRKSMQQLDFTLRAKDELSMPGSTTLPNGQPSGMPAAAVNLGRVISGVESGGKYNIMYSPDGERTFSDFSKHPNAPAVIASGPHKGQNSTAAGKYQFIHGTWKYVAEKIGAKDFSPANQEKGMWFLAQDDYKKTTGRNLQADLESGDPIVLSMVRKKLGGTWEGIKHMSDEAFIAAMGNTEGTPPSAMYDDAAFSELPMTERYELMQEATRQAGLERSQRLKEEQAARDDLRQQMFNAIKAGSITTRDIDQASLDNSFTYEQTQQLHRANEDYNSGVVAMEKLVKGLTTSGHVFSADDQKGLDTLYSTEGKSQVTEMNPDYANKSAFPLLEATGMIPAGLVSDLSNMMQSPNVKQAQYAMDLLTGMNAINPSVVASKFGDDVASDLAFYKNTAAYLPEAERLAELRRRNSPEYATTRAQLKQQVQYEFSQNPADFAPKSIADKLGFSAQLDTRTSSALTADVNALYEREYLRYGNHKEAMAAAVELVGTKWAVTEMGGTSTLMKNAPSTTSIQPIGGSYDWLQGVVETDIPELAGKPYRLASDAQTEGERNMNGGPSYMVETELYPGVFVPMLDETNKPIRIGFGDQKVQKTLALDVNLWNRKHTANTALAQTAIMEAETSSDPRSQDLLDLLMAADRGLGASAPKYGVKYQPLMVSNKMQNWDEKTTLTPDAVEAKVKQMGFDSLDDFLNDLPMYDYSTLLELIGDAP